MVSPVTSPALPAAADPPRADGATAARALIEGRIAMLTRLAEIGMEIAEAAGRRAVAAAEGDATDGPDPGLTFSRAARAVRLTLALQARFARELAGLDAADDLARTVEAARRRERIHDRVERAIEATCDDEDEIERLSTCAWERLEDEDDAVVTDAPVAELVARICRDLGLPPGWDGGAFVDLPRLGEVARSAEGGSGAPSGAPYPGLAAGTSPNGGRSGAARSPPSSPWTG